ncbi:MAG: gamma-glutamyl-gamma-aminobutyrate hydrolase family protein [Deltaproteobacteria bacterium]|nr:gamma-glutamyl-gamma-aminobutyrate hydrolase family protein [Deltaproteobacteria bacterium]
MNSTRPVIGITCHLAVQPGASGHTRSFLRLSAQYARAIREAGGLPVGIGTTRDSVPPAAEMLGAVDALLLSGGTDLPAGSFSDRPRPTLRETDPDRYDYEVELVREARDRGLPLMGICRGHQTLVEALGGRLILNITEDCPRAGDHYQKDPPAIPVHRIFTSPGTRLRNWLGERTRVNSFHRQAVAEPPPGFTVSALSEDGLIEAIEGQGSFALGVQFHPEWMFPEHPEFLQLFGDFIRAAGGTASVERLERMTAGRRPVD